MFHGIAGTDEDHGHHVSHYLIHMVMGGAMLYMYWLGTPLAGSAATTMAMTSGPPVGAGDPGLTLAFIAVLIGSAVWQLDSVTEFSPRQLALSTGGGAITGGGPTGGSAANDHPWLAPRLEIACHIAMCLTMAYMLVLMV